MKTIFTVVILSSFLAGCATKTWHHPTASESQFRQENALCERTANVANPATPSVRNPYLDPIQQSSVAMQQAGANFARAFSFQRDYENCMAIKGYISK